MTWLMGWETENEDGERIHEEHWATSWEEVVGHFTSWMSKTSDVVKGEVICYWGEQPYGNGKPCLYFNINPEDTSEEE